MQPCCRTRLLSLLALALIAPRFLNHIAADDNCTSEPTRIVLAGESTVTDEAGWESGFSALLNEKAECINLVKSGRSSLSYRTESQKRGQKRGQV